MKKNGLIFIIFFISLTNFIFTKKYIKKQFHSLNITKDYTNNHSFFKIKPLKNILEENPNVLYKFICKSLYFEYPKFSIAPKFPNKGYFDELFILSIPRGRVQGKYGHVFIDNKTPQELVWGQRYYLLNNIHQISENNVYKIKGKVAVIQQFGYNNYFHWINEILGRIAVLEMGNIEYDWLYVSDEMQYAKEILQLWGIDTSKIISPKDNDFCIEADELIVPSLVSNTTAGYNFAGTLINPVTMDYVRKKILQKIFLIENLDLRELPEKLFISRKDSYAARKILNEDEIFELFKAQGFVRYQLSHLSVIEQIILFNNANIIVSEQGSGLSNILFCQPGTKVLEIFQAMIDNCFWWQSFVCDLIYFPYMTVPVDTTIFSQCKFGFEYHQAWKNRINIPLELIKKII